MPLSFSRYSSEARIKARARSICRRTASSDSPKKGSALFLGELDILLIPPRQVLQIEVLSTSGTCLSGPHTWFHFYRVSCHQKNIEPCWSRRFRTGHFTTGARQNLILSSR